MNRITRIASTLGLVAAAGAALSSCNIVAPVAYLIGGQDKVDAQFALSDRPTVVFVDDPENILRVGACAGSSVIRCRRS